jgi:hypothetical protein
MENGPFRAPRPVDRSANNRSETVRHVAEQPEDTIVETPRKTQRFTPKEPKSKKPYILAAVAAVVVIVLAIVGWMLLGKQSDSATGIDSSKYQAVFFTNGQVYFGKLQSFNNEYMKLTDIFYVQAQQDANSDKKNPQQTSSGNNSDNLTLVKLGEEIHGPQDEMIISKDQVLFYENLKPDGKVSSTIKQYKDSHK